MTFKNRLRELVPVCRGLAGWRLPKRSRHSGVGVGVNIQVRCRPSLVSLSATVAMVALSNSCGTSNNALGGYTDTRGSNLDSNCTTTQKTALAGFEDNGGSDYQPTEISEFANDSLGLVAAVDYTTVKPIFVQYCTNSCHAPGKTQPSPDLSTYAKVTTTFAVSLAAIKARTMPTGATKVPADKIALLDQWQTAGLPEKAATGGTTGDTTTTTGTTGGTTGSGTTAGGTTSTGGNSTTSGSTTTGGTANSSNATRCLN